MDLKDIVAISGKEGLFKAHGKREDGMIAESLIDGKRNFVSVRQHMFSPLDSITVYTSGDAIELKNVMKKMWESESSTPLPDAKADGASLRAYFKTIVPDHDEEKVYTSDIKKMVKWYELLKSKNLLVFGEGDESDESTKENSEVLPVAKKDSTDKKHKAHDNKSTKAAPSRAKAPVKKVVTPRKAS